MQYSNSNWTFIALNLRFQRGLQGATTQSQWQISVSWDRKEVKHHRECQGIVVASFTEIKTGYRGFETKRNPVFRMLVQSIEKLFAGVYER